MLRILFLISIFVPSSNAREGFYPPAAYTALAESGISGKIVSEAIPSVGGFVVESEETYSWKELQAIQSARCASDVNRTWNQEYCASLINAKCTDDGNCSVRRYSSCGGVLIENFFITVRHCATGLGDQRLRAKFIGPNGRPIEIELAKTALTENTLPDDLSLLRILSDTKRPKVHIRRQAPKDGEPVFAIGFPYLKMRERKRPDYTAPWGDPRVTFGKVTDDNSQSRSICNFSNTSGEWKDNWQWADECPDTANSNKDSRQERGLFLTSTDMLNGMSGSPLFDKRGRLLGIGTNTLKRAPFDYDATRPALYVKASRILNLINELGEAEKKAEEAAKKERELKLLEDAKQLEKEKRWKQAESAFTALASSYPEIAKESLRFISCETNRDRSRRTFPRLEYLESVTLSALSDGSRERLLQLLPCRVNQKDKDIHADDLVSQLLEKRISGVPPTITVRERYENTIEATIIGMAGDVLLRWKRDLNGGWAFDGATLR